MELNEYQQKAMSTCMETCENTTYMLLNLVAEVGEFAGKVAKHIRRGDAMIEDNELIFSQNMLPIELNCSRGELMKEAGDIMWQIAGLCSIMGWELEEVCQTNLDKLASRKERGVIDGEGDNR